jgi:hypothetical protein
VISLKVVVRNERVGLNYPLKKRERKHSLITIGPRTEACREPAAPADQASPGRQKFIHNLVVPLQIREIDKERGVAMQLAIAFLSEADPGKPATPIHSTADM